MSIPGDNLKVFTKKTKGPNISYTTCVSYFCFSQKHSIGVCYYKLLFVDEKQQKRKLTSKHISVRINSNAISHVI